MNWMPKTFLLICLVGGTLFSPLAYARWKYPSSDSSKILQADVALVFGALVRDDEISPLHAERLNAAIDLYERQLVQKIVVSNTESAASAMAKYLENKGIPIIAIEVDGHANQTPDTCRNEIARNAPREVILISQGFHIPRLSTQCDWVGLTGQSLAAERYRAQTADEISRWRVVQIRAARQAREAALLWAALVGLYDNL